MLRSYPLGKKCDEVQNRRTAGEFKISVVGMMHLCV